MTVIDKFIKGLTLNGEDDEDFDDGSYLDDDEYAVEEPKKSPLRGKQAVDEDEEERKGLGSQTKVTPMRHTTARRIPTTGMEICLIKPSSMEDAREITETLRGDRAVVLNLEGLDVDIAQRLIDFTSGSCFAIDGKLQKISHFVFLVTPASVDISGDFQEILGGLGSFDVPIGSKFN